VSKPNRKTPVPRASAKRESREIRQSLEWVELYPDNFFSSPLPYRTMAAHSGLIS